MKLIHLASEFPPARIFGLGRYVHDLARAQVRRGHDVHVLTNSLSGKDQDVEVHGIKVHRIHFPSPPMPVDGATQVMQFNSCLYERAIGLQSALQAPDAVIAHDWLTILAAHALRDRLGGRLVLTMHDTVIGKTFGKMTNEDKFTGLVERWGCQVADAIVAVSRHVKGELSGPYETPPIKIHVVPCGVDPSWFDAADPRFIPDLRSALAEADEPILSYVGRLDPEKGVDRLIEAFARLLARHPKLRLVIAGKGHEQPALESLVDRVGVRSRTRFLGYVTGPSLGALLKVTDILACPSTYEPFGIVPLEGMVNRVPVVVSDTGGMAEIVEHGRSGLKVPPGDAAALAGAIGHLLDRPMEAKRLANAGYERARRVYSWDRVAELVEPVYGGSAVRATGTGEVKPRLAVPSRPKLTAGIRVKNGERYAEECLRDLSDYVDEIVILDDGSTDRTVDICRSFPKVTEVVRWEKDFFHEGIDRNVVLALIKNTNPAWILLPDIDEVFEDRFKEEVHRLMEDPNVDLYGFLFCHFWRSRTHYRIDGKWGKESREFPIPRLVRNQPSLHYPVHRALGTAQITGIRGNAAISDIRVKHYGHLHEEISREKVRLYSSLDPGVDYSYMTDETGLVLEEWKERPMKREAVKLEVVR
jgi:glycogen(starch) synthase